MRKRGPLEVAAHTHIQRSLGIGVMLGILVGFACATPTPPPRQPGTPMKTSCPASIAMPTVEECVEAASEITGELLGSCVRQQCRNITVTCGEWSRSQCKIENQTHPGTTLLAFTWITFEGTLHSFYPVKETHWCEEPASYGCVVKAVIHELAHSCGWDHGQGQNVPGNDAPAISIAECACVDEKGERTPCR
jgi:hypothetical protein